MLAKLSISNYALIRKLEVDLMPGFNTITGETGAGKSIMLGALGLLLGARADLTALMDNAEKCIIEGTFKLDTPAFRLLFDELELDFEPETIVRREITPSGKSRAFVNDTPTRLEQLKQLGTHLVDIHSQHDTLGLADQTFQINLLDQYAGDERELTAYQALFQQYNQARTKHHALQKQATQIRQDLDYNLFLLQELDEAGLDEIDQKAIEEELEVLENAESIRENLAGAIQVLSEGEHAASEILVSGLHFLDVLGKYNSEFAQLQDLHHAYEL